LQTELFPRPPFLALGTCWEEPAGVYDISHDKLPYKNALQY